MTESELREKIDELAENESSEAHLRSKNRRRLKTPLQSEPVRVGHSGVFLFPVFSMLSRTAWCIAS